MRIKWIDCAKGIAMICIIIGHIGEGTYGKVYLSFVHVFHVTFFLLSGYTFKIERITLEYVNRKFRRLMKPYFYTCCVVIVMDIFNSILENHVCICNSPTKRVLSKGGKLIRKTCIDHVFIRQCCVTKCSELKIHENILYSDHYPITFKFDI